MTNPSHSPNLLRGLHSFFVGIIWFGVSPAVGDEGVPAKLKNWLDSEKSVATFPGLENSLGAEELETTRDLLVKHRADQLFVQRAEELRLWKPAGQTGASGIAEVDDSDKPMKCYFKTFGKRPEDGRSVFISMHGGGGAPPRVNDRQWENQKRLYAPEEGIYVAPRAPTDTWNLWHQTHIDRLFTRLIENLTLVAGANPDRVYLMGYSAGGDGVFQLAPRIPDRFAAAAMMAGHPNEASPLGLRNLPFCLQMGGRDAAYKRNQIAKDWKKRLAELRQQDSDGYPHLVKIYPDKGHWMDREDAVALPWMATFNRRAFPKRIVWRQDDVSHPRFYWLECSEPRIPTGKQIIATIEGQSVEIQSASKLDVRLHLDDRLLDLDRPIQVSVNGESAFTGRVPRNIQNLWSDLESRYDPVLATPATLEISITP